VVKNNFLVVQLSSTANTGSGDYIYRIRQPAQAMGKLPGIMVVNLCCISPYLKEVCLAADVLVLHLVGEVDVLPIAAERRRRGLATVFEVSDNFLAVPASTRGELPFNNSIHLSTTFQLMRFSDAIQGVSDLLLEKFKFLHDRRVVFKNQIMEMGSIGKRSGESLTIGWAGSLGHTEDIRQIAPVIRDICEKYPHVKFAFMGNRRQYEEVFGNLPDAQRSYTKPGNLSDYYKFLEKLDVGLSPLMDTSFNVCRSDVKFIEYASRGVVPLVSDVGPYKKDARHGENSVLFEDPDSLKTVLEMLITDESFRQCIRRRAYDYVKKERREEDHAVERIRFYKGVAKNRSSELLPLHLLESFSPGAEAYHVKETSAERKMIQGLYLESKGHLKEAIRVWEEAYRDMPSYHFPLRCVANGLIGKDDAQAIEYLKLSLRINTESLGARLLLGRALKSKDPEAALKEFNKALAVFPGFAPAWKELALLEKERGKLDEAARLMNKALVANPFYAAAASQLGKIYLAQARNDLAVEAFRVAANLIPDRVDYQIDVVQGLLEAGSVEEAAGECVNYLKEYPGCVEIYSLLAMILAGQAKEKESTPNVAGVEGIC
jgi:tetratricopeptide (TPR) repeat protein